MTPHAPLRVLCSVLLIPPELQRGVVVVRGLARPFSFGGYVRVRRLLLFKIGLLFSSARLIRSAVHIVSRPADADQTPYCPVVAALKEHWYVVCAWDAAHNIVYVLEEKLLDN